MRTNMQTPRVQSLVTTVRAPDKSRRGLRACPPLDPGRTLPPAQERPAPPGSQTRRGACAPRPRSRAGSAPSWPAGRRRGRRTWGERGWCALAEAGRGGQGGGGAGRRVQMGGGGSATHPAHTSSRSGGPGHGAAAAASGASRKGSALCRSAARNSCPPAPLGSGRCSRLPHRPCSASSMPVPGKLRREGEPSRRGGDNNSASRGSWSRAV